MKDLIYQKIIYGRKFCKRENKVNLFDTLFTGTEIIIYIELEYRSVGVFVKLFCITLLINQD